MLTTVMLLLRSSLFLSLHLAGSAGSFPKPLSAEEEQTYLARCAEGDLEARNVLVERNMRLVAHIIKKYYTQAVDQDDLISIGTIGLIKGISSYKPEKNVRLATYAARCIENAILSPARFRVQTMLPPAAGRYFRGFLLNLFIMCRTGGGTARFAPLYIHMENGMCERCSPDMMDKLAKLYQVPVTDFLDKYNLFLYQGQGWQIKALRESRGISVPQFAESLGVYATTVRKWEADQARMFKRIWKLIFQPKNETCNLMYFFAKIRLKITLSSGTLCVESARRVTYVSQNHALFGRLEDKPPPQATDLAGGTAGGKDILLT